MTQGYRDLPSVSTELDMERLKFAVSPAGARHSYTEHRGHHHTRIRQKGRGRFVTTILRERRRSARHRRALAYWAVLLAWTASVAVSTTIQPTGWLHFSALFVHLASVIVGLGAILMVDYNGLLWAGGRRSLREVRESDRLALAPAWLGVAGLLLSGAFLHPNLESPLTL